MRKLIINILPLLFLSCLVYSGTTGKLSGYVYDKDSKAPITNAAIFIKEINATIFSDETGYFSRIMLPPGIYSVRVYLIGYKDFQLSNVVINSDKTTNLNFFLEPSPLTGEAVTVTSERKLIDHDFTSTIKILDNESYRHLPKIQNFDNLLAIQPGIVRYNNNLHIRGGRQGEILYVLDGIPIKDILYSGANALEISTNSIQEMTILNSGFNAEYGNAGSGVINIITKNGADTYSGSFELSSDGITQYSNDEYFGSLSIGGPEPLTGVLLPFFEIEIPGKLRFFSSLNLNQSNAYKFNDTYHKNFKTRKIELIGGLFNVKYEDRQSNSYDGSIKLKYDYRNYGLTLTYNTSGERIFRYDVLYKNRMDSALLDENHAEHYTIKWTHTLNNNMFYNISLGLLKRNWDLSVNGLTPDKYNPVWYSQDINSDGYNDLSMPQFWSRSRTNIFTFKGDYNYQLNSRHLFKTGFEINYEEIFATEIQYPGNIPDKNLPGEYPGYGEFHWNLNNYSTNGSAFLQDKIEYDGLLVNAGIRLDYFAPGKQVNSEKYKLAWEEAAQIKDNNGSAQKLEIDKIQVTISPRLGISHPITDKTALFFNYGHFYQLPERQYIFRDPYAAKGWIGNPNLKSPKTVCYEFGFSQEFIEQILLSIKGFYKDYYDYIGSLEVGPPARRIFMFYNSDYANAKGFEITLSRSFSDNFSLDANYTYSSAKGRSESPFEESYTIWQGSGLLPMEVRMPWDQNHNLNCILTYYNSGNNYFEILNSPVLRDLGLTFKWSYGSGFPFTPSGKNIRLSKNSEELPFTMQMDMRIEKKVKIVKDLYVSFFLDCINMLNRKNIKEVNPLTGKAYTYGDLFDNTNKRILSYREILSKFDESYYYPLRQILIGAKIEF